MTEAQTRRITEFDPDTIIKVPEGSYVMVKKDSIEILEPDPSLQLFWARAED